MPRLSGNRCQCPTCDEFFNGTQPFDKHRVGEYDKARRCMSVAEMEASGFVRNVAGFWCERAKEPQSRPRAPVFPAHRTPPARAGLPSQARAPESRRRMDAAT